VKGRRDAKQRAEALAPIQLKTRRGPIAVQIVDDTGQSTFPRRGDGAVEFFPRDDPENASRQDTIAIYDLPRLQTQAGKTTADLRRLLHGEALHALTASGDPDYLAEREKFWQLRTPQQRAMDWRAWWMGSPSENVAPRRTIWMQGMTPARQGREAVAVGSATEAEAAMQRQWEHRSRKDAYLRAYLGGDRDRQGWIDTMTEPQKALLEGLRKRIF